eukprot:CAMPEP_0206231748 /NCGR_PEP_ID=MMETSP0047_2-20121206/11016_1 /ASSEMBLY_ACC=CAM_ASM_000192 /TAXON_ID=195065 /ORGANISM="Chroomonas mesostigmatica_cf, Strain CCMP1168" /LENGTH=58 /DNA_ID=CAMNT_0053655375 /DNA_START=23 /DNA_END=199 /DNA_ORIENTATION=+
MFALARSLLQQRTSALAEDYAEDEAPEPTTPATHSIVILDCGPYLSACNRHQTGGDYF